MVFFSKPRRCCFGTARKCYFARHCSNARPVFVRKATVYFAGGHSRPIDGSYTRDAPQMQ